MPSTRHAPESSYLGGERGHGDEVKFYPIGAGIASLAAAAFMIRDGDVLGCNITILGETDKVAGSLDASSSAKSGYVLRGGRMLEIKYLCTFALFSSISTRAETRHIMQVYSVKQPSSGELRRDFFWRTTRDVNRVRDSHEAGAAHRRKLRVLPSRLDSGL